MDIDACRGEMYTEDGYATWIKSFLLVGTMLNHCGPTIQYFATLFVGPIVVVSNSFDQNPVLNLPTLVIAMMIGFVFYKRASRKSGNLSCRHK